MKYESRVVKLYPVYSGHLGDRYISLGAQKALFSIFLFQWYFNKKYVEVAINDFTMHLIILKRFGRRKWRQKRKTTRQEEIQAKEETVYKSVFF